jgi:starch-binding outer membrane protein, SusD/RagB family
MKRNKIVISTFVSVALSFIMSSCESFFDKLPLNEIVLENFYQDENDLKSVLVACYASLESDDCVKRMFVWGELRSDNITVGTGTKSDETQLLKENVLPSNSFTKWAAFYQTINYCNTVIYYAPIVNQRDPNFTVGEMRAAIAEAKAIRAISYFYLVRAFGSVPYVIEPTIDDTKSFSVPATNGDTIIKYLAADLEECKDYAVVKFPSTIDNTSKFTRYGIRALLADMYLWIGEYQKCIDRCDEVLAYKRQVYDAGYTYSNSGINLYKGIPLYAEKASESSTVSGYAYRSIFSETGSFETIMELAFQSGGATNLTVYDYYGHSSSVGQMAATSFNFSNAVSNQDNTVGVYRNTDCRYIENALLINSLYSIRKYSSTSVSFTTPVATSTSAVSATYSIRSGNYSPWILYRLSDMVLLKAEAEVQLAKTLTTSEERKPYLQNALTLVSATFGRANNWTTTTTDTLKFATYSDVTAMEDLVLLERQREFMFEGKRWFDLVRLSRRSNDNNQKLVSLVVKKQESNSAAISMKLKTLNYLYFPYNASELEVNSALKQNPAYVTDKTTNQSN